MTGLLKLSFNSRMSRILVCQYKAFIEINVPEELAKQIDADEVQALDVDWGRLEVIDKDGKEHKFEGKEAEADYSVAHKISWKVTKSWPEIKAGLLHAESRRMEQRLVEIQKRISASTSETEEEIKIVTKEMDGTPIIPFTKGPLTDCVTR